SFKVSITSLLVSSADSASSDSGWMTPATRIIGGAPAVKGRSEAPCWTARSRKSIKSRLFIRIHMVRRTPLANSPHGATKLGFIADRRHGGCFRDDLGLKSFDRRLQK